MLNNNSRTWLVGGVWFAVLAVIMSVSVALGASLSTSALLLVVGVVPAGVVLMLGFGAPPPTVAELLHDVNASREGSRPTNERARGC